MCYVILHQSHEYNEYKFISLVGWMQTDLVQHNETMMLIILFP